MTGVYNPDKYPQQTGWRAYQEHLRRNRKKTMHRRVRTGSRYLLLVALLTLLLAGVWRWMPDDTDESGSDPVADTVPESGAAPLADAATVAKPAQTQSPAPVRSRTDNPAEPALLHKADVQILLDHNRLINLTAQPVTIHFDGKPYSVRTTLDLQLQQYLLKKMDRINSRYIGIVAMEPSSGRLIAMAGFNKLDPDQDPCLMADYPAASLFKIVTAAAAIEEKGYTAGSRFTFNGYKHTLYKRQLTDKNNRYTNAISLRDAFAQSVNPVFGKIGALYLDRQALLTYGNAFAFNRHVEFELPCPASRLAIEDDAYRRAEIASGFNRQTVLSPLHGAVIVSAVVNGGKPVEPTVIDRILDHTDTPVYLSRPTFLPAAISSQTADILGQLMTATITAGTAKKTFRGRSRHKVLSRLKLGGKTGSIYNRAHDAKFDWFAGYAAEKKGKEKLVVSVMVAHEKYIGKRAGQYARLVIERYFREYFSEKEQAKRKA
ncbi:MAG: PbpA [Proteobacteria bacterium]|nr:MAG: PbpA [Pseudomonadota bacterium]